MGGDEGRRLYGRNTWRDGAPPSYRERDVAITHAPATAVKMRRWAGD